MALRPQGCPFDGGAEAGGDGVHHHPKRRSLFVLRLIVGLALLGCPRISSAGGTWSVISLPQLPGQVYSAWAVAADAAGNLYVGDQEYPVDGNAAARIQKRDSQGNWSVIATGGKGLGQAGFPRALAVDTADNLYVADSGNNRIEKRDVQGNWSIIATSGAAPGQVDSPNSLAVDTVGNLYVAEYNNRQRIQKRDVQGNWSVIATGGMALGQVTAPSSLAADAAGNLYVAEWGGDNNTGRIQRRDTQGNWSVLTTRYGDAVGQVENPVAVAVDGAGILCVADGRLDNVGRIQKRDAQGNWSQIQVEYPNALATDSAGNLYVATGEFFPSVIQKWDAQGNWSVIGGPYGYVTALAVDSAGNLYAADSRVQIFDWFGFNDIQKRDAQGSWSVIAESGHPSAFAADAAGSLYVVDDGGINRRDAQSDGWAIAPIGEDLGQVSPAPEWDRIGRAGLAVDRAGNLYVAGSGNNRMQKYVPDP